MPSLSLNLLSWNYKGLDRAEVISHLKILVNKYEPDNVLLMKTKCSNKKIEGIGRKVRFNNFEFIEAKGSAGGIVLMWREFAC